MNSPVLDVAIGLTFIYVLYSLLATTIKEFVATIFSYRGRMLERAIEQMLDGKNFRYFWWNKVFNWIISLFGKKPFEKSRAYKKSALFTSKVTNHPLYKRSAGNSWLNKKPAYLASDVFSDILIDLLSPTNNSPVLLKNISSQINRDKVLDNETKKIIKIYINQANGDLQRFKLLIEDWYNDTMDRVSGWYKRQASEILLIIGLILAITFNVNTIEIVQKLSKDKVARAALVQSASDYVKKNSDKLKKNAPVASPQPQQVKNDSGVASGVEIKKGKRNGKDTIDTSKVKHVKTIVPDKNNIVANVLDTGKKTAANFSDVKAGLDKIDTLYNESIAQENTTLGLGWAAQLHNDSAKWKNACKEGKTKLSFRTYFVWYDLVLRGILGFFITALAISLGAPFWFDLLNKFVNLRASGQKPDDNSAASKTPSLNQKPLPNSFA